MYLVEVEVVEEGEQIVRGFKVHLPKDLCRGSSGTREVCMKLSRSGDREIGTKLRCQCENSSVFVGTPYDQYNWSKSKGP